MLEASYSVDYQIQFVLGLFVAKEMLLVTKVLQKKSLKIKEQLNKMA